MLSKCSSAGLLRTFHRLQSLAESMHSYLSTTAKNTPSAASTKYHKQQTYHSNCLTMTAMSPTAQVWNLFTRAPCEHSAGARCAYRVLARLSDLHWNTFRLWALSPSSQRTTRGLASAPPMTRTRFIPAGRFFTCASAVAALPAAALAAAGLPAAALPAAFDATFSADCSIAATTARASDLAATVWTSWTRQVRTTWLGGDERNQLDATSRTLLQVADVQWLGLRRLRYKCTFDVDRADAEHAAKRDGLAR